MSRATVSYVLNNSERHSIPLTTQERIRAAAAELGYTPHAAARALRTGESGVVLLVLPDLPSSPNLGKLLAEITAAVAASERSLVTWTDGAGPALADVLHHMQPLAVLVTMPPRDGDLLRLEAAGVPVVDVSGAPQGDPSADPPIATGEKFTGALQVRHLVALGHRSLAVLTVDDPRLTVFAENRLEGVRLAAADLGLDPPQVLSLGAADGLAVEQVGAALAHWRLGPRPVTALACYNDLYAGVATAAARAAGLGVPADLSVVGVDDDPMAQFVDPPLTTVRFDFREVTRHAVDKVRTTLEGAPPLLGPPSYVAELVVRSSTGPVPAR